MNLKQIIILISAILVGFLGVNQFHSYQKIRAASSRDTNVTYANQVNLIVKTNDNLRNELVNLGNELNELRTTANVFQVIEKDIERFELLSGKKPVSGPGVTITVNHPLETFWIIDLLNELYVSGAEAVSINGKRITGSMGFVGQGNPELTMYLNNESPILQPYTIQAIGDPDLLKQYLDQNDGIVHRLRTSLGAKESEITLKTNENITIPAIQNTETV